MGRDEAIELGFADEAMQDDEPAEPQNLRNAQAVAAMDTRFRELALSV